MIELILNRRKTMVGTPLGGRKAWTTTKKKYGEEKVRQWGSQGGKSVKNHRGGFDDPELLRRVSSKGGKNSRRTRTIKIDEDLRLDEKGMLIEIAYDAIAYYSANFDDRPIRLMTDDTSDISMEFLSCIRKGEWETAMMRLGDSASCWRQSLKIALEDKRKSLETAYPDTPRGSKERNEYRIIKNLIAAYNLAYDNLGDEA